MSDRRSRHLPAALLGNGSLLATVSARGELERLFWPRIDWGRHLGEFRLGLTADGSTRWLDEATLAHAQRYVEDTTVLETRVTAAGVDLELVDLVHPERPVLVRRVRGSAPGRLTVLCRPRFEESPLYGGAFVAGRGRLVLYRRGVALALGVLPEAFAMCGPDGPAQAHGDVEGSLVADGVDGTMILAAFGSSPEAALAELERHASASWDDLLAARVRADAAHVAVPSLDGGFPAVGRLVRRSFLVLDQLSDRAGGGVIAAPEIDSKLEHSGGYGYVWGRDLAFATLALLTAGRHERAQAALRFSLRTQSADGVWLQRHYTDGLLAPSWARVQLDQTGALLFAYEAAFRELGDEALDAELWPAARGAADALVRLRAPNGLPVACFDLWEEREGQHSYTAAAVAAGLRAAAAMGLRHEPAMAGRYSAAAESIAGAIERELWLESEGRYARSLRPAVDGAASAIDATVDASLLGLAWPFEAVDPGGERMRATAAAIEERLTAPCGGLRRYEGDTYAGGNAWVLTTLWLGLWGRAVGDDALHGRALEFALAAQTELGLLPEQVHEDLTPAWVVPLGWSHAMFVVAALRLSATVEPRAGAAAAAGSRAR